MLCFMDVPYESLRNLGVFKSIKELISICLSLCVYIYMYIYIYIYTETYICMELFRPLVAHIVKNLPRMQGTWVQSLGQEDPLGRGWLTTPVFFPGEFHGQRSLAG